MSSRIPEEPTRESPSRTTPTFRLGVRAFLFLILGLSSGLPLLYFSWAQIVHSAEHEVEVSDRQAVAAAFAANDQLQQAIRNYARTVEAFAGILAIPGNLEKAPAISLLHAYTTHHPEFLGAYVADARGIARLLLQRSGEYSEAPIDYSDRGYIRELLRTNETAISRVTLGRFTRALSVQVAAPIQDATTNRLLGITCSSVDLTKVADQAKQSVRGLSGGRVVIVDGEGKLIADSNGDVGKARKDLSSIPIYGPAAPSRAEHRLGLDDRGLPVRAAALGLEHPVSDWRVVAMTPQREVEAQARRMKKHAAMLGGLLLLAALIVSAWLSTVIARPLRLLAETAKAVSNGELGRQPRLLRGIPREMADLTIATQVMIESLRNHTEQLETEVRHRTQELHRANTELAHALQLIRGIHETMQADIEKAQFFQQRLLPRLVPRDDIDIAAHYAPLRQVSGDIFDVYEVSRSQLRLFVADATGHGVQASMRTILLKAAYDRIKTHHGSPSAVLSVLNSYLVTEFPTGDFHCTACCIDLRLTGSSAELSYANAGGAPIYVMSNADGVRELYSEGPLLGVDDVVVPEASRLELRQGELLLLTTDGLVEQMNPRRQRFELELKLSRISTSGGAREAIREILEKFELFRESAEIQDDVTLLAIRLL